MAGPTDIGDIQTAVTLSGRPAPFVFLRLNVQQRIGVFSLNILNNSFIFIDGVNDFEYTLIFAQGVIIGE